MCLLIGDGVAVTTDHRGCCPSLMRQAPSYAEFIELSQHREWGWGVWHIYRVALVLWVWTGPLRWIGVQLVTLSPALIAAAASPITGQPLLLSWLLPVAVAHMIAPRTVIGIIPVIVTALVAFALARSAGPANAAGALIALGTIHTRMWGDWWMLHMVRRELTRSAEKYDALVAADLLWCPPPESGPW